MRLLSSLIVSISITTTSLFTGSYFRFSSFFPTGTVGLTEKEAIEVHGADDIECYISSFAPLEWSITERHAEVNCYGKIVVKKSENNRVGCIFLLEFVNYVEFVFVF